jgi:hypothetical protein
MFKPGIEPGSDHFLSGRPRGDSKPDDTYPSYHFQHLSGPLLARSIGIEVARWSLVFDTHEQPRKPAPFKFGTGFLPPETGTPKGA